MMLDVGFMFVFHLAEAYYHVYESIGASGVCLGCYQEIVAFLPTPSRYDEFLWGQGKPASMV